MKNSINPFFSILIPVYNVEKYLERCLNSVINQTFKDIEIICVDDGSTDNSIDILKEYSKIDARIIIIKHEENLSQNVARQTGVQRAIGKYILFLDSDDYFCENACEVLYENLLRNPVDILEFPYYRQPGNLINLPVITTKDSDRVLDLLKSENSYPQTLWNKAYEKGIVKKAFENMNVFYANMAEDCYHSIIIAYYTKTFGYIETPLVNYFVESGISSKQKRPYEWAIKILESYRAVLDNTKLFFEKNDHKYLDKIKGLEEHLLRDAIYLIDNVNQKEKALLLLSTYFDHDLLVPHLEKLLEKSQNLIFLNKVKRKIKKIIKK